MRLTSAQTDRAAGVLLGQAIGDALGVPYEFGSAPLVPGHAELIGGGLGGFAPGEWSDDTAMAACIARVSATGADLTGDDALAAVAQGFVEWIDDDPADVGMQIGAILRDVATLPHDASAAVLARMRQLSDAAAAQDKAGNGALMRTGVVGLVALDDRERTARAAAAVAALTHADSRCVDSCVLWSEAVRVAVIERRLDVRAGLDLLPEERRGQWETWIDEAETWTPSQFAPNGYTVTAFQAAWAAIHATAGSREAYGADHVEDALQTAIAIGDDTDTVAAIAGALLGARYGVSGLPTDRARRVHGWPHLRGRDLVGLALATATREQGAWPQRKTMRTGFNRPLAVPHPADSGVLLGTEANLDQVADPRATAVVSLSRVGTADIAAAASATGKHVEVWLVDSDSPDGNADLAWTLRDAARTVRRLREEGETVLLHCVAAFHRTPSVALAYARLIGVDADTAARDIEAVLGRRIGGRLWETARTMPL
ncbi:ADP-ribosylglycohydrolase family protein [Mobilicoccus pelagius]|uniref:Putative hydrolase n=1 Tax=Mobilicoccus pelagius NBRC 104925 TaxID=1089455 RepID=H5UW66_9MICO|nr:ADP-ribosylglycohydrolase family protein [Mobilicoccus pelagius]GAB49974.1 putative hydrolase [Mobilicoccus pelagius NBRC 104925]